MQAATICLLEDIKKLFEDFQQLLVINIPNHSKKRTIFVEHNE